MDREYEQIYGNMYRGLGQTPRSEFAIAERGEPSRADALVPYIRDAIDEADERTPRHLRSDAKFMFVAKLRQHDRRAAVAARADGTLDKLLEKFTIALLGRIATWT
jgi:hypothetical protein